MADSERNSNGRLRINWFLVRETATLAKDIISHRPEEDCPIMWRALRESVNELNDEEKLKAAFFLVVQVLAKEAKIESLFALARATGHKRVAYATAAIAKAMRAERMESPTRLIEFGLVEIRTNKNGRSFFRPLIGSAHITTAVSKMSAKGLLEGARILQEYLDRATHYRQLKKAERVGKNSPAGTLPVNTSPEVTRPLN